jgi:hypothetical protein
MERFKKSKEFNSSDGCCAWWNGIKDW